MSYRLTTLYLEILAVLERLSWVQISMYGTGHNAAECNNIGMIWNLVTHHPSERDGGVLCAVKWKALQGS